MRSTRNALLVVLLLTGCVCGCVWIPAAAEAEVSTQIDVHEGMVRTITDGVSVDGGGKRPVTYDELVRYVYASRFGWHALAFDLNLEETAPTLEAFAPPGGWNMVDPSPEATPAPTDSPR